MKFIPRRITAALFVLAACKEPVQPLTQVGVTPPAITLTTSTNAKVALADLVKDAKVTIDQAIKTASEKAPGTVVEAELEKKHGKTVWEVEVLGADGKVTEVHIDAATGAVIDVNGGMLIH